MFDKLKYISFFVLLSVGVFASASEIIDQEFTTGSGGEYANLDTVFERVIGLGYWCETKGQINAYFQPEKPWMETKKGHADIFDWLFINDYNCLSLSLNNHLEDFFEKYDFYIIPNNHDKAIVNRKYNMCWNHLFDGYTKTYTDFEGRGDFLTEQCLDSVFPKIKEKINYLKDKFIESKTNKTLYIISHP